MSHLDILLPFGLPPAEMAADLLRVLKTPALASIITRTKSHRHEEFDAYARALPHESWLARQFGMEDATRKRGSPPIAVAAMQACGLTADPGRWFLLHPVHLHVARDHLVLTNQRQLSLTDRESRALFETIKPLFAEIEKPLLYGDARHWFVRADQWDDLHTATPDAASGHNIDIWMPQGPSERDWRKLQNEIQMHWHTHPVNEEREFRGEKPVNSVWLWGGAAAPLDLSASRYSALFNLSGWADALSGSSSAAIKSGSASDLINAAPKHGLTVLDALIEPALGGDWAEWIKRMHDLESSWFGPISEALRTGKIAEVSLIVTHSTDLAEFTSSKYSLKKFWSKPSLSRLVR